MWDFLELFKSKSLSSNEHYVEIPDTVFDEMLKREIQAVEMYAEEIAKSLQEKYVKKFEKKNRTNLKVYVHRDIDGDEGGGLSSDNAFEKEYRSLLAIDYDDAEEDEQYADISILLWYYFGGYRHGTGTLYQADQSNLERKMEEDLKALLNRL